MKRIAILSVLFTAALSFGVAMAERIEVRAQHDRLWFGAGPTTLAAE